MKPMIAVLAMLLGQIINLMIPVSIVRCIGADGDECVEVAVLGCFCCDGETDSDNAADAELTQSEQSCGADCCKHDHSDLPVSDENSFVTADCACQHSTIDDFDQTVARSAIEDALSVTGDAFFEAGLWSERVGIDSPYSCRRMCWLRPCVSPHLSVVAIAVLRV